MPPTCSTGSPPRAPDVLCVCAFGVLIREPLLSGYELLNVHPSLLPRWRGAAPIERAIMAGDSETGVSIMRLTAGLDSGPVCLQEAVPITGEDDFGTLAARLEELGGELLVRALDERPPFTEQDAARRHLRTQDRGRDRTLDFTRRPIEVERTVRALRPHIGARLPLPDGSWLGVIEARVPIRRSRRSRPPAAACASRTAGCCSTATAARSSCLEIRPPGGRPMAAAAWLRGRPPAELTSFWLDPRLPERPVSELVEQAVEEWGSNAEWAPHLAALAWRGDEEVLAALRELPASAIRRRAASRPTCSGSSAARRARTPPARRARWRAWRPRSTAPTCWPRSRVRSATSASRTASTGCCACTAIPDATVRDAVADALAGRSDARALDALIELSADPDPRIRDLATFALGALAGADTPALRAALAERLYDADPETAVEAMHGLAIRGDARAADAVLRRLESGGTGAEALWTRHALEEATIRLAALTGDPRFGPYLPADLDRFAGTMLEGDLRRALERCGAGAGFNGGH